MRRLVFFCIALLAMLVPQTASAACSNTITAGVAEPVVINSGQTQSVTYHANSCDAADHVTVAWSRLVDPAGTTDLTNLETVQSEVVTGNTTDGTNEWNIPVSALSGKYVAVVRYYTQTDMIVGTTNAFEVAAPRAISDPVDQCGNVDGLQVTVPTGMTHDTNGNCFLVAPTTGVENPLNTHLAITKTANVRQVHPGGKITYTIVVRNIGPDAAINLVTCDTLPRGTSVVRASGTAYFAHGKICWSITKLGRAHTATMHLTMRVATSYHARFVTNRACAVAGDAGRVCATARVRIVPARVPARWLYSS